VTVGEVGLLMVEQCEHSRRIEEPRVPPPLSSTLSGA
jgi:hypothetical protein